MAALVMVLGVITAACADSDEDGTGSDGGSAESQAGESRVYGAASEEGGDDGAAAEAPADLTSVGSGAAAALPSVGISVIKDARLAIEVPDGSFRDAFRDAIAIADSHGGFVSSSTTEGERSRRGLITMRVPSVEFEAALAELHDIGRIAEETVSGRDVSEEFIDLEARLRHLRSQERVMLDLMEEATSVDETIRVQGELQNVQLEIERIRGRLRFLEDRTSLGTIEVEVREESVKPDSDEAGTLAKAWDRAVQMGLTVVSAIIVTTGAVAPILVLVALALLGLRFLRPRVSG